MTEDLTKENDHSIGKKRNIIFAVKVNTSHTLNYLVKTVCSNILLMTYCAAG